MQIYFNFKFQYDVNNNNNNNNNNPLKQTFVHLKQKQTFNSRDFKLVITINKLIIVLYKNYNPL